MLIYKHPQSNAGWIIAIICAISLITAISLNQSGSNSFLLGALFVGMTSGISYQWRQTRIWDDGDKYIFKTVRPFRGTTVIHVRKDQVLGFKSDSGSDTGGLFAKLKDGSMVELYVKSDIGNELIKSGTIPRLD